MSAYQTPLSKTQHGLFDCLIVPGKTKLGLSSFTLKKYVDLPKQYTCIYIYHYQLILLINVKAYY